MKNNSKIGRRGLLKISMRVVIALVVVGLLVIPVAVQAELKATSVVYAWDFSANYFRNSLVRVPWDGTWIPFLHEINFDTDLWPEPEACGGSGSGTSTRWAGNMYYGLYYVDDDPLGAPGFQESRNWSLISCDRNGDGIFNNRDLDPPPDAYDRGEWRGEQEPPLAEPWGPYAECVPGGDYCNVLSQDVPEWCSTGNCLAEIVTTLQINVDPDCDGIVDDLFPTDPATGEPLMLCFYAEAKTPDEAAYTRDPISGWPDPPPDPPALTFPLSTWKGNPQGRISIAGGDKTVNFSLETPTAVDLAAFDAAPQDDGVLLTWETASELDNLGFNIYRAESQEGQLIKINQQLIASQNLGSTVGATYSFLDESAAPGATYYYWLEDIDLSGATTKHGPVAARTAAEKALPGRPRPAPMPSNAF